MREPAISDAAYDLRAKSVPPLLAVRGEAIMRLDDFRALNAGLEKAGRLTGPVASL